MQQQTTFDPPVTPASIHAARIQQFKDRREVEQRCNVKIDDDGVVLREPRRRTPAARSANAG